MTKRRLERKQRKKAPKQKPFRLFLILLPILFVLYQFLPSHWDGSSPVSLVIADKSDVIVAVFDPDLNKTTTIIIPGTTQVTASNQLGTWKLSSIWQLGDQENLGGQLLADTIMKSFGIPVDEWSAREGKNLISKNELAKLKAVFSPFSTSLTFKDKVKLIIFSMQNQSNQFGLSLEDTNFLQKTRLMSGEEGYLIRSEAPPQVLHLFADPKIIDESARIGLINATGSKLSAVEISKIIHALGSKIYFIEDREAASSDCLITAKNQSHTAKRLSNILNCDQEVGETSNNLSINLTLGEDFAKRF